MNRRSFIRTLVGGVAGVLGAGKVFAGNPQRVSVTDSYFNDDGQSFQHIPPLAPKLTHWNTGDKNELLQKVLNFRRAELKAIWDEKVNDIMEEALWGSRKRGT